MNSVLSAYFELAKPRITILLVAIALISYFIAAGAQWVWLGALHTVLSVGILSVGIFALNHWMEQAQDKKMVRTRDRPIPSGRVSSGGALVFGVVFLVGGLGYSFLFVNLLTGFIGLFVAISYLLIYTPLKYHTPFHTALGAFPGATPPLAGWAVAIGALDLNSWVLFGVLFLWQFPHFLAIEMIYKDDYAKANIKVLPVVDKSGFHVAWQVVGSLVLLVILTAAPYFTGLASLASTLIAGGLGLVFLAGGIRAVTRGGKKDAKLLLRLSVAYLPLIYLIFLLRI